MGAGFGRRVYPDKTVSERIVPWRRYAYRAVAAVGAVIVLLLGIGIIKAWNAQNAGFEAARQKLSGTAKEMVDAMMATQIEVARMTKDPERVKFRGVGMPVDSGDKLVVCGFFNGVNGFGAYVGEQRFIRIDDMLYLLDGPRGESPVGAKGWDALCSNFH